MPKLPRQLPWRDFQQVLRNLGYTLDQKGPGSARIFIHATRLPRRIGFHEPHNPKTIPPGTLRAYIRELNLSLEEFLEFL